MIQNMRQDKYMSLKYRKIYAWLLAAMVTAGVATTQDAAAQVTIKGSVYGGGNLADVQVNTEVNIAGGTIGTEGQGGVEYGNVYGGGKGKRDDVYAGLVKGNTKVKISQAANQTTTIYHNVYGGGAYGSVGTFTYDDNDVITGHTDDTGKTEVYITGGTFGWNGKENGMVFGSSRGDVGTPGQIEDKLAWVYDTHVAIGDTTATTVSTSAPIIRGSVYGGGENGHNYRNSYVRINGGTIGVKEGLSVTSGGVEYSGAAYPYRGNVYGGGCGTDKYYSNTEGVTNPYDGNGDTYNAKAGIVQGNAFVNITGGYVVHNVYGAGAMGSVGKANTDGSTSGGKTTVTISGGRIGYDGNGNGNVFCAARGEYGTSTVLSNNLANVRETEVNISYTATTASTADNEGKTAQLIAGSVFGGGEAGTVKESVAVNMTGGLVLKDVYGGGALADTQTSNWNTTTWATGKSSSSATTTVRLTGGRVVEEVYGGGLGEAGKPAYVWGDVLVDLNGTTTIDGTTHKPLTTGSATTSATGCVVGQVFGCNNVNGTPKGDVMVHVYATQNAAATQIANSAASGTEGEEGYTAAVTTAKVKLRYDVEAVYGGGNQATYDPVSPYTTSNTSGAKTQVIIDGCSTTSIETVYGGGNAAAVPETNVTINAAYEIGSVFGGGNGYSETNNHSNPSAANYNPGADVGTKDHGVSTANNYGTGNANTVLKGGLIHEAYGGSNQYGKIIGKVNINTDPVEDGCPLDLEKLVGAGKNADVDGDLIMILGCKPSTKTPLVFAGADNADVNGNVELTITSGTFGQVFGGNNLGGHIKGHIKLNIEETGCNPIVIDELYLGGNKAAYSRYGYYLDASDNKVKPRTAAMSDPQAEGYKAPVAGRISVPYDEPELNIVSCTSIGKVFGGGLGVEAEMNANPTVNINMIKGTATGSLDALGTIGDVYGGGNAAKVIGNTTVNIGTATKVEMTSLSKIHAVEGDPEYDATLADNEQPMVYQKKNVLGANITGNVYGGGQLADVGDTELGTDNDGNTIDVIKVASNTFVNIGASKGSEILDSNNQPTGRYNYTAVNLTGITIGGNVFGGGEGEAAESGTGAFRCGKAMVTGGTNIAIGNGTINGTIYGGGEVGRVEGNTIVTIGIGEGGTTPASAPEIKGDVFGAGKGEKTHGYSALVRGNPVVTIEGDAKVRGSVYGGGEIASVGKYNVKKGPNNPVGAPDDVLPGMPYSLANSGSGYCTVIVQGNAEIGPENEMKMKTTSGKPDDTGHVFGAGKGVLPYEGYGVTDDPWETDPWRVSINNEKDIFNETTYSTDYEKEYFKFIETLALATETHVTIAGNAFVKGSVYGGSMNGHVQHDTHVTIAGGQIGQGESVTGRYSTADWASESLAECPHWDYDASSGAPYDPLAETDGSYKYDKYGFVPTTQREETSKGGLPEAKDGHTYYGNVFGGGSGVIPYAPGRWHRGAGSVGGDTYVNITGGHILTSVYGGNEHTDVGTYTKDENGQPTTTPVSNGKCTVNMKGGTVGVPRTDAQKLLHPVVGNLYGAGKGDQRIFFNTWTNVISAEVNISGDARIFGSIFGGGEDGHVISDAKTNIGDVTIKTGKDANGDEITEDVTAKDGLIIGTTGTSYYDGNVFGGGRGFSGDAQTAGTVGGNIEVNINKGAVYGSVYGGGRLASVGTMFEYPTLSNGDPNPAYGNFKKDETGTNAKTYGHVVVNISGGTIGNENATGDGAKYSGNVFGGSMGRLELLNGTRNPIWAKMAQVKSTAVNIYGDNTVIRRNVYGGGELGTVRDDAYVTIGGYKTADADKNGIVSVTPKGSPTIRRDVYGGGYGSDDKNYTIFSVYELNSATADPAVPGNYDSTPHTYAYSPMQFAGCVGKNTYVNVAGGYIRKNVYGGGEMASVGVINYRAKEVDAVSSADVVVKEATANSKAVVYSNMVKHADATKEFALSWPYEFNYVEGYEGATHVKVTGGRLGLKTDGSDNDATLTDNGDVYGAGKGKAGDFNDYIFCANVGSTDVKVAYSSTPTAYSGNGNCIAGAVYGGGEDGHVMGNTNLTISGGLIYHSVYGGGSGKGKFSRELLKSGKTYGSTNTSDYETRDAYSITAGKVFGSTTVEMSDGYVVRNIYGGGNMGSVGKGNYAGGTDDYSYYVASDKTYSGYGETLNGTLWTASSGFNPQALITETNKPKTMADHFLSSGKCTVKISGGTVGYINESNPSKSMYPLDSNQLPYDASLPYGNVFGGCRGESVPNITDSPRYYYCPEFFVGYANETEVIIEGNAKILGSVYGGGMDGHVRRDASVTIKGGEIGLPFTDANRALLKTNTETDLSKELANIQWLARGNVYGAGSGIGKYGDAFCTSAGSVTRFTSVDVQGGTIHRNVYGGGSLSSIGAPKIPADRTDYPTKAQTLNEVIISGGQIGDANSYDANGNHVYGGEVFGGSRGDAQLNTSLFSTSMFTSVTINANADATKSPVIAGSVYGGGEVGIVKGSVDVTMNGGTVNHDVYGGGALANTNTANVTSGYGTDSEVIGSTSTYKTVVDLFGGMIKGDAYGGGLGRLHKDAVAAQGSPGDTDYVPAQAEVPAVEAKVYGDVTVTLGDDGRNGATAFYVDKYTEGTHAGIVKSGRVFGCNNLNGSPQGGVTVKVNMTKEGNTPRTAIETVGGKTVDKRKSETASDHSYHVAAVYGGGNLAGKTVGDKTNVIINGCDVSIRQVYGGGNAAAVPGTDVLVNGAWEIEQVFGGGNGKDDYTLDGGAHWTENPGANVNGNTNTLLCGGLIHEAYGGSNEKGTITGSVSINTSDDRPTDCDCELDVEKIVGAGKNADVNGDLIMVLGCKPTTKTPLVFGGADNANVNGNVELTITSGTFGKVFGGNNLGGIIKGHIILNIEETGCNPIKIEELYLGGNQAAYSVYGYYDSGTTNPVTGKKVYLPRTSGSDSHTADPSHENDDTHSFPYADPVLNVVSCTSIGKVFGGGLGEGAVMYADPTVNINMISGAFANDTEKGVPAVMAEMGLALADNPNKLGIIGDVYGGGNAADVIGDPTVNIGTAETVQLHQSYTTTDGYVMSGSKTVEGAYINGNVFGGGMGKADEFTCAKAMVGEVDKGIDEENNPLPGGTNVVIAKGKVNGSVYGGGEVGRVERNTKVTIGREGAETEAIIKGSVFGAGAGVETHGYSALVRGNAEVTIQGKAEVWQNVYGGGEKASVGRYNVRLPGDTQHPEVRVGMPYSLKAGGKCTVNIMDGATIGTEGDDETGHVYGAGQGITPVWAYTEYTSTTPYKDRIKNSRRMVNYSSTDHIDEKQYKEWDYYVDEDGNQDTRYVWEYFTTQDDYLLYVETLARASETDVVIGGKRVTSGTTSSITTSSNAPTVKGSVYGGSESGFVYYSTEVNIPKGTVKGDVFGGGKGLASYAEAGRVRRNTNLTISGGAVEGNVYGGGSMGDVGTIDKTARDKETGELTYNYVWKQTDGTTDNTPHNNTITDTNNNTGICTVTITGGSTIGVNNPADATKQGNVFGAGRGSGITWWCEKAIAYATNVTITDGTVKGNVYGGGQIGRVEDDAKVTIGTLNGTEDTKPAITGSVYGAGAGLHTHGYSALLRGNSDVAIQGTALVGGSVFGGGEIASVGRFHVVGGLPTKPESGGYCTVTIQDNAKIGLSGTGHDVYGACKGVDPATITASERKSMQLVKNKPEGEKGTTWDEYEDEDGNKDARFIWRIYTEAEYPAFLKTLALTSHPHVIVSEDASVYGSVYGGGQRGVTLGHVDVDIVGGAISQDVYGGGALADTNLGNWDENGYVPATSLNEGELITDLYTRSGSGTTESPFVYTKVTDPTMNISSGTYYRQQGTWSDAATKSAHYVTKVNILGGTISGDAYGGGLGQLESGTKGADVYHAPIEAKVYGDVVVNLNGFDKTEVKYVPAIHGATTGEDARLELVDNEYLIKDDVKGAVVRRIFGCNNLNGSPQGTVKVHVFKTQRAGETRITNTDGVTTAKVHVTPVDGEYDVTAYDVQAVYGGGNMAAYVPKDLTDAKTLVIIDGCDRTSIGQVYGGGNAASTPATDVTVNGTFEIAEVFGGGNGKDAIGKDANNNDIPNPGANVGFYDYSAEENIYNTKEKRTTDPDYAPTFISKYVYGSGKAAVNIFGGTIHRVFGGSNTKGNVRLSAITLLEEVNDETGKPCCEFHVDEAYGGGKSAPMDAEAKLLMSCIPGLKEAYGGAEAADVYDDVSVTITNGNFDRVFGGNNLSGTIRGKITVNVEETGCKPIIIGELYGGGNQAGYSTYGYRKNAAGKTELVKPDDADAPSKALYDDPVVNVRSFTTIGNVFGGGYGDPAVMVGNPTVNINEVMGEKTNYTDDSTYKVGNTNVPYYDEEGFKELTKTIDGHDVVLPQHKKGKIGAINYVYGGGNAADVIGNTHVNIGTKSEEYLMIKDADITVGTTDVSSYYILNDGNYEKASGTAVAGTTYYKQVAVVGVDIRGNVYGGGNNAAVTGNTNVTIGKETNGN